MDIKNASWRKSMELKLDYNNMMKEYVGEQEGFSAEELFGNKKLAMKAFETVKANRGTGMMGWTELPYNQKEIVADIIATAKDIKKKFDKWGKNKCWLPYSEMQYKKAPKKIVCEKFLIDEKTPGVIPDYKVYCFHGEPLAVLVMHDRGSKVKAEFFNNNWEPLAASGKYDIPQTSTAKPECFVKMMEASRRISKPFPFVRCDFYIVNNRLYFGEMTFTPAGGLRPSQTIIDGKDMTEYLSVFE